MSNIYHQLKVEAAQAGTNLNKVCRSAGISRQTVQGWGKKEPKVLAAIRKIRAEIDKAKIETKEPATA